MEYSRFSALLLGLGDCTVVDLDRESSQKYMANEVGFRAAVNPDSNPVRVNLGEDFVKYMVDAEYRASVDGLPGLEQVWSDISRLNLRNTEVEDIAPLAALVYLRNLNLSNTLVENISPLSGLVGLEHLDLSATDVQDINCLSVLPSLKYLNLNDTPVSQMDTRNGWASLQTLYLENSELTTFYQLGGLQNLKSLFVTSTRPQDVGCLGGLASLQYLANHGRIVRDLKRLREDFQTRHAHFVPASEEDRECVNCCDEIAQDQDFFAVCGGKHKYCRTCLENWIEAQMKKKPHS